MTQTVADYNIFHQVFELTTMMWTTSERYWSYSRKISQKALLGSA